MCNFIYFFCIYSSISYIFSYIPNYIYENSILKSKKDNNFKILYISHYIGLFWSSVIVLQIINYLYFYKYNLQNYLFNCFISYYIYDLFYMIRIRNYNYIIHHIAAIYLIYLIIANNLYNKYVLYGTTTIELPTIFLNLGWIVNYHNKKIVNYIFIPSNIIYIILRGILTPYYWVYYINNLNISDKLYNILCIIGFLIYSMSFIWSYKLIKITYKLIKKIEKNK